MLLEEKNLKKFPLMRPKSEFYQESTQWIHDCNGGVTTLFLTHEKTEDYLYG